MTFCRINCVVTMETRGIGDNEQNSQSLASPPEATRTVAFVPKEASSSRVGGVYAVGNPP